MLAVIRSNGFDDALAIANNTEYGLTGAIYSGSREKLERAREEFNVGNLYFNRKCTGAMVGAHPFGGFNMSGTDSKAGGPDYLLLFTQAKSIAEKVGYAGRRPSGRKRVWGFSRQREDQADDFIWRRLPALAAASAKTRWWMVKRASSRRSETPDLS